MIEINPQFGRALDLIKEGKTNLFITGKAGTGKSTLLDYFSKNAKKKPVILAPTGVAALNVKGQTIHSFFNFYVDVTVEKIITKETRPRDASLYKKLKTIIIDEISMVRADLLDVMDVFLRMYGPNPAQDFGGVQMVFVGDLYQLPPVVSKEEYELFRDHYKTPYFFSANVFAGANFEIIELEKLYRQKEARFVNLLNQIRNNSIKTQELEHLNSRFNPQNSPKADDLYISLTTTNQKANEINDQYLESLNEKMHHFDAKISRDFKKEFYPTATRLEFKIGSQIMMLNNEPRRKWVNGSIGVIEAIKTDIEGDKYVNIRLQSNDRLVVVYPHVWEIYKYILKDGKITSKPVGTFEQFPFRLAWAITIHKSQGKTFDKVIIDIGRGTFATGQIYVALSRCTSFEGVILKTPIKKHHILTDHRIHDFLTNYQYQKATELFPQKARLTLIKKAIKNQQTLKMTYLQPNDTKSTHLITPIWTKPKSHQGKKYQAMLAFSDVLNKEQLFHVGRILELDLVS